jgi:hypothetical protein
MGATAGRAPADGELATHLKGCAGCAKILVGVETVERAIEELGRASLPAVPPFDSLRGRAAAAARGRRRKSLWRKLLPSVVMVIVSAAIAVFLTGLAFRGPKTRTVHSGDVLEARTGSSSARLPSGTSLMVESGRVSISARQHEERVHLESGALSVSIPPLPAGEALWVETSDGDMVAHGTRFRVDRSDEGTRVVLDEGSVLIHQGHGRPDIVLHPGEAALVEPLDKYRERLRTIVRDVLDHGQRDEAADALAKLLATEPGGSMAGEAHAMMGLVHQVRDEPAAAADEYRRALASAGAELWADNAAAELALLEERRGAAAGIAAWRDYLARFHSGLHRTVALSHLARLRTR